MFKRFKVKLNFVSRIDGGIPATKDRIIDWLKANGINDDALAEKLAAGVMTEAELEPILAKLTTTFVTDANGDPCLEARCVKAMFKQAISVMGLQSYIPGLRELAKEGSEIEPQLLRLGKKEHVVVDEHVVHAEHQGKPMSSFKRTRFIDVPNASLELFVVTTDRDAIKAKYAKGAGAGAAGVADPEEPAPAPDAKKEGEGTAKSTGETGAAPAKKKKVALKKGKKEKTSDINAEMVKDIFTYAGRFCGLGANRSQGCGKFEVVEVVEVDDAGNAINNGPDQGEVAA